ncbi:MAG TPA: hypothetical protein VF667_12385 [Pseudonocardia sp.]
MAEPTLTHWPPRPSLLLPPIDDVPALQETDPLGALVDRTRPHGRLPHELPGRVTVALWTVLLGAAAVGGWLAAVRAGLAPGSGLLYGVATLGHPGLLLVLAAAGAGTLLVLVPFTGGLRRAGGPELAAICLAGAAGAASLAGVALLALLAALVGFLLFMAVAAVFES